MAKPLSTPQRSRSVTLKDLAERCGVSTATVARVLHENGYVAQKTRERVKKAIAETGYRLNGVARGLRKQRTFTIGHIVDSIWPNPFFAEVALGVEQEALSRGCSVLMYNVQGSAERERMGVETLLELRADAILFTVPVDESNVRLAMSAGVPIVQLERATSLKTHIITVDNYCGSLEATEHLLSLGHKRIAFLGQDAVDPGRTEATTKWKVEVERFAGYLDALHAHGIARDDALILMGSYYSLYDHAQISDGYTLMKRLLELNPPPTAVFAACDLLAAGVYQALYEHGLRVPDDVSVVGFDDTYATHLAPPLTTVQQPMGDIGRRAARMVLDELDGEGTDIRTARLATRLVIRASTGPATA